MRMSTTTVPALFLPLGRQDGTLERDAAAVDWANASVVEVLETISNSQKRHVRERAEKLSEAPFSEAYDDQNVWSAGGGILLNSANALALVRNTPGALDWLRQKLPLPGATRLRESFTRYFSPSTPEPSTQRKHLGALVSPAEAVAMLQAVHELLARAFPEETPVKVAATSEPKRFHSVSLLSSRIRQNKEDGFGHTHHGAVEYALEATLKASLTGRGHVLLEHELRLLTLPAGRVAEASQLQGVRTTNGEAPQIADEACVCTTGSALTVRVTDVDAPVDVSGLAYMFAERMRTTANDVLSE